MKLFPDGTFSSWDMLPSTMRLSPLEVRSDGCLRELVVMVEHKRLNNGTGSDDFIVPDGSSLATNMIGGIGMDFSFLEDWSVGANILVSNLFASEDRAIHYSIQFHYSIEELIYGSK